MAPGPLSILEAVYRLVLRLYPSTIRREFGEEMEAVFGVALAEAAQAGLWPALRFLAREAAHAPGLLLRAHLDERARLAAGAVRLAGPGGTMTRRHWLSDIGLPLLLVMVFWAGTVIWPNSPLPALLLPAAAGGVAMLAAALLTPAAWSRERAPALAAGIGLAVAIGVLIGLTVDWVVVLLVSVTGGAAGLIWRAGTWPGRTRRLTRAVVLGGLALAPLVWVMTPQAALAQWPAGPARAFEVGTYLAWPVVAVVLAVRWAACAVGGQPMAARRLGRGVGAGLLLAGVAALLIDTQWWDSATDGLGAAVILVYALLPAAGAAGMLLARGRSGLGRLAVMLLAVVIPAGLFLTLSGSLAGGTYHAQTDARAAALASAIERFHARRGRYPATLADLPPWYRWRPYEPIIFREATWCYEGGIDFYRLGAVYQPHFGSPAHMIRVREYAAAGTPPATGWACDDLAEAIQAAGPR